jgi:hypothetical protein
MQTMEIVRHEAVCWKDRHSLGSDPMLYYLLEICRKDRFNGHLHYLLCKFGKFTWAEFEPVDLKIATDIAVSAGGYFGDACLMTRVFYYASCMKLEAGTSGQSSSHDYSQRLTEALLCQICTQTCLWERCLSLRCSTALLSVVVSRWLFPH